MHKVCIKYTSSMHQVCINVCIKYASMYASSMHKANYYQVLIIHKSCKYHECIKYNIRIKERSRTQHEKITHTTCKDYIHIIKHISSKYQAHILQHAKIMPASSSIRIFFCDLWEDMCQPQETLWAFKGSHKKKCAKVQTNSEPKQNLGKKLTETKLFQLALNGQ